MLLGTDQWAAPEGIGQYRQLKPSKVSSTPLPQGQHLVGNNAAEQSEPRSKTTRHHAHKLPPLMTDASTVAQPLLREGAHVLRRRSSFIKASRAGNAQDLLPVSMHPSGQDVPGSFSSALLKQSRKGTSTKPSFSTETLGGASDLASFAKKKIATTPGSPLAAPFHSSDHLSPDKKERSVYHSSKFPEARQVGKSAEVKMYDALRQSIAQVKACTSELQGHWQGVQSMQNFVQIVNAQIEAMLDRPNIAVQQPNSH